MWGASTQYKFLFRDLLEKAAVKEGLVQVEAVLGYEFYRNVSRFLIKLCLAP